MPHCAHPAVRSPVRAPWLAALLLALPGCLHDLGAPPAPSEESVEAEASLQVGTGGLSFVSVTNGWPYQNPLLLAVSAPSSVVEVIYDADGWELGASDDRASGFAVTYRFNVLGERTVRAEALDERGQIVATATRRIIVVEPSADTPYFYQFANALSPAATCQNTSISMVLASLGWSGVPDDVTAEFGRFRAQSTAGLAAVFNELAGRADIAKRLVPSTDGTLAELRDEVRAGRPVIVHGYFTGSGHVMVVLGYDGESYVVNDPAGTWNLAFQGGYPNGWEPGAGRRIRYPAAPFERAIASFDGRTLVDGTLWYHLLR